MTGTTGSHLASLAARVLPMSDQDIQDELDGRTTYPEPLTYDDIRSLAGSVLSQAAADEEPLTYDDIRSMAASLLSQAAADEPGEVETGEGAEEPETASTTPPEPVEPILGGEQHPLFVPAVSSTIKGTIARDGGLEVVFNSGERWFYSGVSARDIKDFHTAPSPGGFFAAHIKSNYQGRKL